MVSADVAGERWRNALAELEYAERHGSPAEEVAQLARGVIEARVAMFQAGCRTRSRTACPPAAQLRAGRRAAIASRLMADVEQLTGPVAFHAEGPVWSPSWGGLRWVDMFAGDVLSTSLDAAMARSRAGMSARSPLRFARDAAGEQSLRSSEGSCSKMRTAS